ncbi:flagellar basal-body MS-ring/collar protein FliF [Paenibacillus sp. 481]|uniref:flagellar basal-body MS-ring/collar protein FliF n=1 Tax=Paenibacillus sp. 481 TaxID=2835869 RepID=UPI001E52925E|nr:flagellar basal-body MS-ring/collar protein FliF [Paenibacillus sp. 481]UHA73939.1 flagellar M-ring protein FliF [Paenibacillus sp. 481]
MNEKMNQYREKASQYWNQFSKKQKILLASTVGIMLLAITVLTYQLSKTDYELAFKDLNANDAAGIIEYLTASNIPFQLSANGTAISVPVTAAAQVKVDVGAQGIVKSGSIGFEQFTADGLMGGMTDNVFDVRYNNALNGEIERLLSQMQGVQDAKVIINLPQETVFATPDEEQASASIVMRFKPGYRPDQSAVDGYYNLIKTAVPNLAIDNITISSDEGPLFASGTSGTGATTVSGQVNEQLKIQRKYENDIRLNVQQFLANFMGPEQVNVLVSAKLNFDKVQKEENLVTPVNTEDMKGIEISVQELQESFNGTSASESGVAGVGTGEVTNYPADSGNGDSNSEKTQRTVNYEVNRFKNLIEASPYAVKDLTIHAAVDTTGMDPNNVQKIENVLRSIVSAQLRDSGTTYTDEQLTQKVSVLAQNGSKDGSASQEGGIPTWVWYAGGALALLAIAGGIMFVVMRRRKRQEEMYDNEYDYSYSSSMELPSIDLENLTNENQVRKQLEMLAQKKPDEFVKLLRTWLVDESR